MTLTPNELEPHGLHIRTSSEIAQDGGHKGKPIRLIRERTGEDALNEWEKDHGSIDIPTYRRNGKRTGRERFSDN